MATETKEKLVTAEELGRMSLDFPCELVDGRIVRMSPAALLHGVVVGYILDVLTAHVRQGRVGLVTSGETGFRVRRNPDRVRAPDLAFVSNEALARGLAAKETFFPQAPDLAVEVLSPDDSWSMIEDKVKDYLSAQGQLVWVVSPVAERVYVYEAGAPVRVLERTDEIGGGAVLPGLRARVSDFFPRRTE